MITIETLCKDGFRIESSEKGIDSIAFLSLKTALKAYFSTYKSIAHNGASFLNDSSDSTENSMHTRNYIEQYSETIVHFQHFFELICKDILRKEHELLVLNIDKKHEILFKLLQHQEVPQSDLEGINTIEFSGAFERLCKLIETNKLDARYNFFTLSDNKKVLIELNKMRNKIWHRGSYVMRYQSLDLFIGKYILPLAQKIVNLTEYNSLVSTWKYNNTSSGIEPLDEIIKECNIVSPSLDKIAFLKELGRAAYDNPLSFNFKFFNDEIISRASRTAISELHHPLEKDSLIIKCPVCGVDSLVKNEDSDGDMNSDGTYNSYWTYVWYMKCYCCNFELYSSGMKNPSEYGYDQPIYWDYSNH